MPGVPPASGRPPCGSASASTGARPGRIRRLRPRRRARAPPRPWRWAAAVGGPPRILLAKPGLDGHSNGAEQLAVAARDAGMEVIYVGIRSTPDQIARAARDEDVDLVGLSILSGSHLRWSTRRCRRSPRPGSMPRWSSAGSSPTPIVRRSRPWGCSGSTPWSTTTSAASSPRWPSSRCRGGADRRAHRHVEHPQHPGPGPLVVVVPAAGGSARCCDPSTSTCGRCKRPIPGRSAGSLATR
ncbi:MAG: cobalamin-dependent protein [Acidimicrobiales bacterium]